MAMPNLESVWEQRLIEHEQSGLNIATWCQEQSIQRRQFFYWRKKLRPDAPAYRQIKSAPQSAHWISLDECASADNIDKNGITVYHGTARIELQRGFDHELLRDIVKALQSI